MTPFNTNFGQGRSREGIRPDMNWRELTKQATFTSPAMQILRDRRLADHKAYLEQGALHKLPYLLALLP